MDAIRPICHAVHCLMEMSVYVCVCVQLLLGLIWERITIQMN